MPGVSHSSSQSSSAFSATAYTEHLVGLAALLMWRSRWESISYLSPLVRLRGPMLELGLVASQRFVLGFPVKKHSPYGNLPFLAVQSEELQFLRRLQWSRAYTCLATSRLMLITNKVLGDDDTLEDLPAMGFSIEFDDPRKLEWLSRYRGLDIRSLWFDEDGHHVGSGKPPASLPLRPLAEGETPFPRGALVQGRSLRDLIGDKLERTNRLYLDFKGPAPVVPGEFQEIVSSFDPAAIPSVRPKG